MARPRGVRLFSSWIVGNGLNRQPCSPFDCCCITGASRPLPGQVAWCSPSQWPVSWLTTMCR